MTDYDKTIEAMAKAIAECESEKPYNRDENPYGQFFPETYMDVAKAALAALQETMPDMKTAPDARARYNWYTLKNLGK